jgi:hypothetical protein
MHFTSNITLPNYILSLDYFIFTTIVILLSAFILTHPVNFLCGRKAKHPEKTHRAVRRSPGIFCRSRKTPADKIMKNYFIFQWTFGNGKIKLNDLKLLESLITRSDSIRRFENSASALLLLLIQKSAHPNVFWAKIQRCHAVLLSTKHCLNKHRNTYIW